MGAGKLLDPSKVRKVWVSPRRRAVRTFQLLFGAGQDNNVGTGEVEVAGVPKGIFGGGEGSVVVSEEIREWDYGEYEGMRAVEVRELRARKGLDKDKAKWSVWRDGCEGGEYVCFSFSPPPCHSLSRNLFSFLMTGKMSLC